jgi:hypothetical protein
VKEHPLACLCVRCEEKKLIAAANMLCETVQRRLPEGWKITLEMSKDESTLTLSDPDGEEMEFEGGESHYSAISSAIDTANEVLEIEDH